MLFFFILLMSLLFLPDIFLTCRGHRGRPFFPPVQYVTHVFLRRGFHIIASVLQADFNRIYACAGTGVLKRRARVCVRGQRHTRNTHR